MRPARHSRMTSKHPPGKGEPDHGHGCERQQPQGFRQARWRAVRQEGRAGLGRRSGFRRHRLARGGRHAGSDGGGTPSCDPGDSGTRGGQAGDDGRRGRRQEAADAARAAGRLPLRAGRRRRHQGVLRRRDGGPARPCRRNRDRPRRRAADRQGRRDAARRGGRTASGLPHGEARSRHEAGREGRLPRRPVRHAGRPTQVGDAPGVAPVRPVRPPPRHRHEPEPPVHPVRLHRPQPQKAARQGGRGPSALRPVLRGRGRRRKRRPRPDTRTTRGPRSSS